MLLQDLANLGLKPDRVYLVQCVLVLNSYEEVATYTGVIGTVGTRGHPRSGVYLYIQLNTKYCNLVYQCFEVSEVRDYKIPSGSGRT